MPTITDIARSLFVICLSVSAAVASPLTPSAALAASAFFIRNNDTKPALSGHISHSSHATGAPPKRTISTITSSMHPSPPSPNPRKKKKAERDPGKDLKKVEVERLFKTLEKYHPLKVGPTGGEQGKPYPSTAELNKSSSLPPSKGKSWSSTANFDNAVFFIARDGWLVGDDMAALSKIDPEYEVLVNLVPILNKVDFSSLREPREGYANQEKIDHNRVILLHPRFGKK